MSPSGWDLVVGLEIHAQLSTRSKMFSNAPAEHSLSPNTRANELDFGMPGTLPVANREAVGMAIRFGLAVGGTVAPLSEFARKHYFYPDLPKGYQISQYENPVVRGGHVSVRDAAGQFTVPLVRAHLEEDAGKLVHDAVPGSSAVDYNRSGLPLLEIVTEPTMRSSAQASAFARVLRKLLRWLDVCDGNMQEGSLRFDVNVSLRRTPQDSLGTRCEIKNLNSFRFLEQAIEHEAGRQAAILGGGGAVAQETRLFDTGKGATRTMRGKEDADDYRYFPDPDLLPLRIGKEWIEEVAKGMPELPDAVRERFVRQYSLGQDSVAVVSSDRDIAAYFERTAAACPNATLVANWIAGDLSALIKKDGTSFSAAPVSPLRLAGLLNLVHNGTVSGHMAKDLLARMWRDPREAAAIVAAENLAQISDSDELKAIVAEIMKEHPEQAGQYRAGKVKLLGFFVGKAMKATAGKANPKQLSDAVRNALQG